jgi:hypothetical protein
MATTLLQKVWLILWSFTAAGCSVCADVATSERELGLAEPR